MSTRSTPPPAGKPGFGEFDDRVRVVWEALEHVLDPEIPVINVVQMGMIADVAVDHEGCVVSLTPTFAGCPAIDVISRGIREAVKRAGESSVTVNIVYDPPWTSDRISEEGLRKLKSFGLAPPKRSCGGGGVAAGQVHADLESTPCPYCESSNTELESIFGPTLCRSIHYCHACRQSFEHFKAI